MTKSSRMISYAALIFVVGVAALWLIGSSLIGVQPRPVPMDDLNAEAITLRSAPDQLVAGSYLAGQGRGAILLLHGIRADRRQMAQRARFFHQQGYSVLLIDLPGQGASTASAVTFGLREGDGVREALAELRRRAPGQRIGVIGVSLGAASMVLCRDCGHVDAVVLESMYPTITEAVANRLRMRIGMLGAPMSELLLVQLPLRLGISKDQLCPIDHLHSLNAPVMIISGSADQHTTLAETQRLFAASAEPKELWIVPGAAHVDLHAYATTEYEQRVGTFMAHNLTGNQ
ncbi:alpha/beta hydrolase [Pseudoduganella sp. FT25W]|uniref:Alpha/beta hydrolase n=1 Tax=Duganella alba TaxID=2666081 RepID=A0A6L5QFY9_9BURK|nr:alpha/beta hydrolase [Duganella alba]MRX08694.1 alpha/beta hydrolase [Duganella alba]MRX18256.1 alpha/beta hydrolase [Duganella alba]